MFSNRSFGIAKASMTSALVASAVIAGMSLAHAETVISFNGQSIDSTLVDAYIAGRLQKPVAQATSQEVETLTNELTDVFLLSTLDIAKEIANEPAVAAQLELQRIGILARVVVGRLAEDIVITEEEILKVYEEQIKLAPGLQYKARHILVETQSEAIEIIELLIGGSDFAELAKERSTGPSGPNGGELGWFVQGQMVQPFSDAVEKLEDGRYTTDPVQTQYGWHVILREDSRPAEPPPLEGVRENIVASIESEKLRALIEELRAEASQ
jgi:peptidyl-prolyl cis-trans isomerase C